MRFGLMMPFQNPPRWARPYPALYREFIEQTVLAEELGYDTIWLTEPVINRERLGHHLRKTNRCSNLASMMHVAYRIAACIRYARRQSSNAPVAVNSR